MNKIKQGFSQSAVLSLVIGLFSIFTFAQQIQRTPFDVTNYRMDVTFNPINNQLQNIADVTFTPLQDTRTVTFELNGSLKVESVTKVGGTPVISTTPIPTSTPAKGKPQRISPSHLLQYQLRK